MENEATQMNKFIEKNYFMLRQINDLEDELFLIAEERIKINKYIKRINSLSKKFYGLHVIIENLQSQLIGLSGQEITILENLRIILKEKG